MYEMLKISSADNYYYRVLSSFAFVLSAFENRRPNAQLSMAMDYVDKRGAMDKSNDSCDVFSKCASILRLIHRSDLLGVAYQQKPTATAATTKQYDDDEEQ